MANGHGGYRPGSGRKSLKDEFGLKKILEECFTKADRKMLFQTLKAKAKEGDTKAAELCLAYLYGKPKAEVGITATDGTIVIKLGS